MGHRVHTARVVIPAYNALSTIRACVSAVAASAADCPIEIVVVDDGANPGLDLLLADLPARVRSTGGSGSAAVARNMGAADYSDGVLLFIDADVVVTPLTMQRLISPIQLGDADAVVGNYCQDVSGQSFASKYKQLYISRIYDRRAGYLRNDFWTAVGAIDAATFHAVGGFDPSFVGACGEDGELGVRLTAAGRRVLGVPEATGQHRHSMDLRKLIINDWRKGRVALKNRAASNGPLSDNKHAGPRDVVSVVLAVVAVAAALALVLGVILGLSPIWMTATTLPLVAYLFARSDLIIRFSSQGSIFLCGACLIMLLLDLVRCGCIVSRAIDFVVSFSAPVALWRRAEHA